MQVIDDKGNLFGLVNVIDALVVLVVLAVAVGGAAFVFDSQRGLATTNVTLNLGTQPDYIVEQINEGDSYSPTDASRITITDVYVTPQGSDSQVLVRAQLRAPATNESISYDGASPRLGRGLSISTDTYIVKGTIRNVGGPTSFTTTETTVQLRTNLSSSDAQSLNSGDSVSVASRTVATIDDVAIYDSGNPDQRIAYVTARLQTLGDSAVTRFGATTLREGTTITLPTDDVVVEGQIQRVGTGLQRGATQVVVEDTVSTEAAEAIDKGDTYRIAGRTVATVSSVTAYGTNDPERKQVYVGLNLTTLQSGEYPQFGPVTIREGVTVPFETPEYSFGGTVQRVGATEQRGQATDQTVTLQVQDVPPTLAGSIEVGATETTAGTTVARITEINRTSSSVILTSQDGNIYEREHPVNQDITFKATLSVRETRTGTTFKGDTIQRGSTITLDLGDQTIRATVVSL